MAPLGEIPERGPLVVSANRIPEIELEGRGMSAQVQLCHDCTIYRSPTAIVLRHTRKAGHGVIHRRSEEQVSVLICEKYTRACVAAVSCKV